MLDEIQRSGEPDATTLPPALNNNRVRAAASQLATFWSPPATPSGKSNAQRGARRETEGETLVSLNHRFPPYYFGQCYLSASANFLRLRKLRGSSLIRLLWVGTHYVG